MHASIHQLLKGYIETHHSTDLYLQILKEAETDASTFEAEVYHNDADTDKVVTASGKLLSKSRDEFLYDVGVFGAPGILKQFEAFTSPDWNVLDLVGHVEARMHNYVRTEMGALPPGLKTERISDSELQVDIKSHRRMGGLAKGFIQGFANAYGNTITIDAATSDTGYSFLIKKTA